MRHCPHLLARVLVACLALLLGACAGTTSDFDRIAPPVRFLEIRETASWVEGFDDAWWPKIDAAYDEYNRTIDQELVAQWDAFCTDAADERLRGQTPDKRRARVMWTRYLEVNRALGEREHDFADALLKALPHEAEPFVRLLSTRIAFRRATCVLREPMQDLPGPLEVMRLVQRRRIPPAALELVAAAYARLASECDGVVRARANAYIDTCGDMEGLFVALRQAQLVEQGAVDDASRGQAIQARTSAEKASADRTKQWEQESLRLTERIRLALQREGRAFAQMLGDAEERSSYLDQLDFALHDGIRSARGIEAFARIARSVIIQRFNDEKRQAALLKELDGVVAAEIATQRTARIALSSGSPAARKRAYEQLQKVGDPVGELVGKALEEQGGVWRVLERTPDVMGRVQSADDAAEDVLNPPPEKPVRPDMYVPPGRDQNLLLLLGSPLAPSALGALSERLGLDFDSDSSLGELSARERMQLEDSARQTGRAILGEFERLDPRNGDGSPSSRVARFMGKLSAIISRQRALDSAANDRVFTEASRLAGVAPDDERVELARLELDLLLDVGIDRGSREGEPIAGVSPAAILNPFELARIAARNADERAAAEGILRMRAEALRAGHRVLAREIRSNLSEFLVVVVEMQSVLSAGNRWRPKLAGRDALELRLGLAREFRAVIGDAFADRYEQEIREIIAPGCEPVAPAAMVELKRLVEDPRGKSTDPDSVARAQDRLVVKELLEQCDERCTLALREFVTWRANWVRLGDYEGRDSWRQLERTAPRGWLIWSRCADAIDRAIAMSAVALDEATVEELGLHRFSVVIPRRMKPYFE